MTDQTFIQLPGDCTTAQLCADVSIQVADPDCKDVDTLCFKFDGLCLQGCLGPINIPCQDLPIDKLESCGVVIPGLGLVTYINGDFHLAVDPNGQLANLGYQECADIKFDLAVTDLAGCTTTACFDFKAEGGDHAPTVTACVTDGCIIMPSNCGDLPSDLSAAAAIKVCDPDCKDVDTLCIKFDGLCLDACLGKINIAPQDLDIAALKTCGVVICGLGTATLDSNGNFHLAIDPNGELAKLGYQECADIKFDVKATDLAGCTDSTSFDFNAQGGDHAPTVTACVTDGSIQMPSDCGNLPGDLCADAVIKVCDPDCKDVDTLCIKFDGLCMDACLGHINIPAQDLSVDALKNGGVCIAGLGTATLDSNGDFHLAIDPKGELAKLGYQECADLKFDVKVTDLAGCTDSTSFDFKAQGGDHAPTVTACVTDGCIQMPSDCGNLPSDLSADAIIKVCDPDCKDVDTLCIKFDGLCQDACLGKINIAAQDLNIDALKTCGVVIAGLGTATLDSNNDFHLAVDPKGELAKLGYLENADIKFDVKVTDLAGCTSTTCFDFNAAGGDHKPVIIIGGDHTPPCPPVEPPVVCPPVVIPPVCPPVTPPVACPPVTHPPVACPPVKHPVVCPPVKHPGHHHDINFGHDHGHKVHHSKPVHQDNHHKGEHHDSHHHVSHGDILHHAGLDHHHNYHNPV
jgi:hypothetical protein